MIGQMHVKDTESAQELFSQLVNVLFSQVKRRGDIARLLPDIENTDIKGLRFSNKNGESVDDSKIYLEDELVYFEQNGGEEEWMKTDRVNKVITDRKLAMFSRKVVGYEKDRSSDENLKALLQNKQMFGSLT